MTKYTRICPRWTVYSPVRERDGQEYFEGSWTPLGSSRDRWDEVTPLKCLCNQAFQSLPVQLFFLENLLNVDFKPVQVQLRIQPRQPRHQLSSEMLTALLPESMDEILNISITHISLFITLLYFQIDKSWTLSPVVYFVRTWAMFNDSKTWSVASLEQSRCTSCWGACLYKSRWYKGKYFARTLLSYIPVKFLLGKCLVEVERELR